MELLDKLDEVHANDKNLKGDINAARRSILGKTSCILM